MKKKKIQKQKENDTEQLSSKNPKIELLSEISALSNLQLKYIVEENYDDAIKLSEKIMRLSIKNEMEHLINEQKDILNQIALKVQKGFFISEINEAGKKIEKMYNILLDSNNYSQAHEILETFINNYQKKIDVESIPIIQKLKRKDFREGIKSKLKK